MTERIRDISFLHDIAELFGDFMAEHQVADQRFTADQKFIRQNIPWPYQQPAGSDQTFKICLTFRFNFEIIFEHHCLTVERERFVVRIGHENFHHLIDNLDEPDTKLFVRPVPRPVPMGMRNDDALILFYRFRIHEL